MRAVLDTNVIAYLLLDTPPFTDEATQFWRQVRDPMAPASWEAELVNVVWMATRYRALSADQGRLRLKQADGLGIVSVPSRTLWEGALSRAVDTGLAVYDTLFVELAHRERLPLATFDAKVIKAFPRIARRPLEILKLSRLE